MKIKILTTNIISGSQKIHGPYKSTEDAIDHLAQNYDYALCFHYAFDQDSLAEVFLIGPQNWPYMKKQREEVIASMLKNN